MPKLNDLHNNLEEDIDMTHIFPVSTSRPKRRLGKNFIKDLYDSLSQIDLRGQKIVQYYKNRTINFDGIGPKHNVNPLDISQEKVSLAKKLSRIKTTIKRHIPRPKFASKIPLITIIIVVGIAYIGSSRFIVENQVKAGYEKLSALGEMKSNLEQVEKQVRKAKTNFTIAQIFFLPYYLIPTEQVNNGKLVITGGIRLTTTLRELLAITEETQAFVSKKGIKEVKFSQLFINLQPALVKAQNEVSATIESYKQLKLDDPEMQAKLEKQLKNLETAYGYIKNINSNFDTILSILGHTKEKKYLIVFQNSDEIRPTGGFMGSMAILGIFRGQITEFSPKDVYDLEWNLKKSGQKKEKAPEGLNKITDSFGLRDSNYFTSFDESSNKIKYFTEAAGFPIDGVFYLNQTVILDFLKLTGAIQFDKIGEKVDETNFSELISILVESKKFKSGTLDTPKQILFDFAQVFLKTLQDQKQYKKYLKILAQNAENREIVFYPFDKRENEFIKNFNLSGEVKYGETFDFMYPVFTSISGNKSDRYIKRGFEKYIQQKPDCSVETTFRILQTHDFQPQDEDRIKSEFKKYEITDKGGTLLNIQGKGTNKQYVRVVLPRDALIQKDKKIKVEEFATYKSVNFYTEVNPGETRVFDISYTLKNTSCGKYDFKVYKQPGIKSYDIKVEELDRKDNTYRDVEKDFYYEVRK